MLIIPIMLLGIGVALFRRSSGATSGPRPDAPMQLLRWATGLLCAQRAEWGQAMLGELAHLEGRARRWRFTIGCVGAALLLPPWGRAAGAVWAMVAVAVGGLGLYASVIIRYQLGASSLIGAAIVTTFLLSFVIATVVLLRRPGVAVPGLLGGLVVAFAWLAASGFTFSNMILRVWPLWAIPLLFLVVPAAVGGLGTLWGGDAAAGRRIARLAGISAGLGVYLYGTLAVAVFGAGGLPDDAGFSVSYTINDRLGNNVVFYLALLPLVTATFGWSAAALTTRIKHVPDRAAGTYLPAATWPDAPPATRSGVAAWPRNARVAAVSVAVVGMLGLAFATGLRG